MSYSGITLDFQSRDAGSIPAIRSRRGAGVVERTGLQILLGNRNVGSNPTHDSNFLKFLSPSSVLYM